MGNMSYCRFSNTALDFKECLQDMQEADSFEDMKLSEDESNGMYQLASYARMYLRRFEEMQALLELEYSSEQLQEL
jgi:hypothetical protein